MQARWRFKGSGERWFWLARIIRGSSQQVNTSRGVDRGSVAKQRLEEDHPVSDDHLSQDKLARAIIKLWAIDVVHNHFAGLSQIVGKSMSVGMRIFNIGGGLSFGGGLCRVFVQLLLVGLTLRWLHRLRTPGEVLGPLSSQSLPFGGLRGRGR